MFTGKEKEKAFDRICERFFKRNFGTMSKPDMETLMFDIYIEHLLDHELPFDDYTMSKTLGISQSKIRNLKVRKELQYPRENFDWIAGFAVDLKKASYDDESKKVNVITAEERKRIVELLKGLEFEINELRPIDEAIITAGGVCTDEINPSTMESKIVNGLYFCGEVIDVDAYTGGFNLQIAFSTAFLAGNNI